jgi:thioredoxin reductase (NADPH)
MPNTPVEHDVVIIGGGPAGLTAALYLARFHLKPLIIDGGSSRAATIPVSRNVAGFPAGVSGRDLLRRMRDHALRFGAILHEGEATGLTRTRDHFRVQAGHTLTARRVLLATGVRNNKPRMDAELHDEAVATGRVRYCPICDGFEVTDRKVAVLGTGAHAAAEALFLRSFSPDLALVAPDGLHHLDSRDRTRLAEAGIVLLDGPAADLELVSGGIEIATPDGRHRFDSLYPALGSEAGSRLAAAVGARLSDSGCIIVDSHQRTDVPGLYAAGDVVMGLDQISHAIGEGGVAATTIRNDLASAAPLLR